FLFAGVLALFFLGLCSPVMGQTASAPGGAIDRSDPVYELVRWKSVDAIRGELLVQFKPAAAPSSRASVMQELGGDPIEQVEQDLIRVRYDDSRFTMDEAIARCASHAEVAFAEPNQVYWLDATPNDPKFAQQWGALKINCKDAWDLAQGDPSAVVALIDSGFDMTHPDLNDSYAYGHDYYANDSIPQDNTGHGSHTAGTAAGEFNNTIGVAGISGYCRFASYRAGNEYLSNSAIVSSINAATSNGALVISMSFGSGSPSTSIQNALNNAYNAGVVNVASAGNDGDTAKNYPAAYSSVIAVASSTQSDTRSSFSTYGNWVDVAAPGSNILSTYLNGGYATLNGTSMACPHVAGMAVLLYSLLDGGRTKANADIVRNTIQDTAVNVGTWVIHGRVDLFAAVSQLATIDPPALASVSPSTVQAFNGGTITLTGYSLGSASEVTIGDLILERETGFTVIDSSTLSLTAPLAQSLGVQDVFVTNPAGTSNVGHFTYIETDPIQMTAGLFAHSGVSFNWSYGGGANKPFLLLLAGDNSTIPLNGKNILANFIVLYSGLLNAAGTGSLDLVVPAGFDYTMFYTQFLTFGPGYIKATGVKSTLILP
ncbi:MAG: S8 family serine peptidase, partial [Planctomycetota bacterium]